MRTYATYCSAAKRRDPGDLPAIERYLSPRIRAVAARAAADGAGFLILSGRFGFVAPEEPIPWYDHLLREEEAEAMAERAAEGLRARGVGALVFFCADPALDPNVRAYLTAAERACALADVGWRVEILR